MTVLSSPLERKWVDRLATAVWAGDDLLLTWPLDGWRLLSNFPVVWTDHGGEDIISCVLSFQGMSRPRPAQLQVRGHSGF